MLAKALKNEEIKETVQDLIDRLLYLPEQDRCKFISSLSALFTKHDSKVEIINGVRIYKTKNR